MNTPTPEQIAWLAGIYEGEGYAELRMHGNYGPYPSIAIQMTDLDVLEQIQNWFGGRLTGPYQNKTPRIDGTLRKQQWKWAVQKSDDVLRIGLLIYPWLKQRRKIKMNEVLEIAKLRPIPLPSGAYKRTEKQNQMMSELKQGFTHSDETKRKISISKVGKEPPNKGKQHSEETKRKMREAWERRRNNASN